MLPLSTSLLCALACLQVARFALAQDPVQFSTLDISQISLYGSSALYRPNSCPKTISFTSRPRVLAELSPDTLAMYTAEIVADGHKCTSPTSVISFSPIGKPEHLPPQWLFEDAVQNGMPVNLTCGEWKFSIRYGYLNDVKTPNGFLDASKVYLDFAVYPYTVPFTFCSYVSQRTDQSRAVDFAPFPTLDSWNAVRAAKNLPPVSNGDAEETDAEETDAQVVPSPEAGDEDGADGGALERVLTRFNAIKEVIGPVVGPKVESLTR